MTSNFRRGKSFDPLLIVLIVAIFASVFTSVITLAVAGVIPSDKNSISETAKGGSVLEPDETAKSRNVGVSPSESSTPISLPQNWKDEPIVQARKKVAAAVVNIDTVTRSSGNNNFNNFFFGFMPMPQTPQETT
ncbi:MAG TPA: hypothetical protein DCY85_12865, partial [Firmicutes bacterium]|nr:hypothetical protein [Bacillota bacterium]